MSGRFKLVDGTVRIRAADVREGDALDFQGDTIADPEGQDGEVSDEAERWGWAYEHVKVKTVERETPGVVVIYTNAGNFGFPDDHMIEAAGEQPLHVAVIRTLKNGHPIMLEKFETLAGAESWITEREKMDPEGVANGDYGIDAPEWMVNPYTL